MKTLRTCFLACVFTGFACSCMAAAPVESVNAEVTPGQLEFRRQAVRRMIFDRSQDIRLSGLWPAKVVDLDVLRRHPEIQIYNLNRVVRESIVFDTWRQGNDVHFKGEEQAVLGRAVADAVIKHWTANGLLIASNSASIRADHWYISRFKGT